MSAIDPIEEKLTVVLEATGEIVSSAIQSYRISSSFLTPTDAWSFVVYNDDDPGALRTKFRPLQPVRLSINGQTQLLGRIDKIQGTGESGAALEVSGRDYLADMIDATVDPSIQIKKEMDLGAAILEIFRPFGIDTLLGDFDSTRNILSGRSAIKGKAKKNFKAAHPDEFRPAENEGVFQFAEKIAARHGFMVQPAAERSAVTLCAPHDTDDAMYSLSRPGNVMRGVASRDWTDVPTVTIARGRGGDPNVVVAGTRHEFSTFDRDTLNPITRIREIQRIISIGDGVREPICRTKRFNPKSGDVEIYGITPPVYRPLFYQDKDSKTQEQLEYGARKMVADHLKKTLDYSCTVRGHVDSVSGALWTYDTLAKVRDAIEQIDENLWLYERDFYNDGQGPMTDMKLCRPGSYVLG